MKEYQEPMGKKMREETEWTEEEAIAECIEYANNIKRMQGESLLKYVSDKALKKEQHRRLMQDQLNII